MTTERRTYTVAEVAAIIGCSRDAIYDGITRGEIPVIPHMGRRKLIARTWVDALLDVAPADKAAV